MACPAYPTVAAATVSWSNTTAVRYACVTGYSMQGEDLVSCTAGVWSSTLPQCAIVYENHEVTNLVKVYEYVTASEIPTWMIYLMAGSAGMAGLTFVVGLLLCCIHLLGCYSGPVVGFGGNHVYPKKQCCDCAYCCCCCCRCCKKCCTGPDDDDDDEDDEEQIGLPMLEKPPDPPESEDEDGDSKEGPKVDENDTAPVPIEEKKSKVPSRPGNKKKAAEK